MNSMSAGLTTDPKDSRFCGYAEAMAGGPPGLVHIIGESHHWPAVQAAYRETLFGKGSAPKAHAAALTPEQFAQALKNKTRLPLATVLRCRLRYFTDGAALGGQAFVAHHLARYRKRLHRRAHSAPRPLPSLTERIAVIRRHSCTPSIHNPATPRSTRSVFLSTLGQPRHR
jgi:hypothetical protein